MFHIPYFALLSSLLGWTNARSGKPTLVLLGDSILETFYGTSLGHKVQRAADMEAVWQVCLDQEIQVLPSSDPGDHRWL